MEYDKKEVYSDDEGNNSPAKNSLKLPTYLDNDKLAMSTKKMCESSLNVVKDLGVQIENSLTK